MINDAFVFDCVAHPFNFDPKNAYGNAGLMFNNHLYAFHNALTPDDQPKLPPEEFLREWRSVGHPQDGVRGVGHRHAGSDAAAADRPVPGRPVALGSCADLAGRDPDRTVFWGSVNPLEGRRALDLMERQVGEFNARAFKFYNVRYDFGSPYPWRMDDPNIAFPIFEKAQELGVNLIGVHKGVPLGPQPIEHTQTWDMDGAAANFPDINFVIYHVGLPFLDETCWQLIRYPNLYASIAATVNFIVRAPRMFAEILGKLLFWCGEDKIIYGSEAPSVAPAMGAARVHGLPDPRGPVRRLRLPAAHRPGQAQDPRREPAPPARPRRGGGKSQAGQQELTAARASFPGRGALRGSRLPRMLFSPASGRSPPIPRRDLDGYVSLLPGCALSW